MPLTIPIVIKGVTNLSELKIDVDKDWGGKSILNVGSVGIGTTSPSERLHVAGNVRIEGDLYLPNIPEVTPTE